MDKSRRDSSSNDERGDYLLSERGRIEEESKQVIEEYFNEGVTNHLALLQAEMTAISVRSEKLKVHIAETLQISAIYDKTFKKVVEKDVALHIEEASAAQEELERLREENDSLKDENARLLDENAKLKGEERGADVKEKKHKSRLSFPVMNKNKKKKEDVSKTVELDPTQKSSWKKSTTKLSRE